MSTAVVEKSSSLGVADDDGSPASSVTGEVAASQPDATSVTNSSRLYYLDWIRVLALLFVFLLHVVGQSGHSVSFVPDNVVVISIISPIPVIGITLFFIVSGAASMFSLERRTSRQFLRERVLRLGLPFLIGGAVLVPPVAYVGRMLGSNQLPDFQGSLWDFYGIWLADGFRDLSSLPLASFGQWLWVLGFLFVYSVIALPVLRWLRSSSANRFIAFTTRLAGYRGGVIVWVVPAVVLAVAAEAALLVLNIQTVAPDNFFMFFYNGWGGLMRLFGLFLLGAVLVRNREVLRFVRRDWRIALLVMVPALLLGMLAFSQPYDNPSADNAAYWMVAQIGFTVAAWCFALVVVAAGQRWLNRPGRLLAYSLGVIVAFYVLHVLVLAGVEYVAFVWIGVDGLYEQVPWVLALIVLMLSFVALIAVIELVVRPIAPLRKFLGVTKERIPGQYNKKVTDHEPLAGDQAQSTNLQKNSANRPPERELVASGENPTRI